VKEYQANCRGSTCGTKVLMRQLSATKWHPYDLPIPRCPTCGGVGFTGERQAVRSMFDGGGVETLKDICATCKGKGEKPISHYTTCPNADEFRYQKAADE